MYNFLEALWSLLPDEASAFILKWVFLLATWVVIFPFVLLGAVFSSESYFMDVKHTYQRVNDCWLGYRF
jgi:hypothetical protein